TPCVLVVDDEVNIAHFVKDFLEENGFSVMMAHTGKDGMAAAVEGKPDVILLDVELPDTDGYTLCRSMRQKLFLRNKPILMLTALNDSKNELAGLRAGADDYLTKPIDTARLLARLNTAIHRNIRELDANPLTHLPGNTSIVQEIERLIESESPYAVIYADLNNFKAFNDRYGFLRGDQAIKLSAQCLATSVESAAGDGPSFVGHVGGDDFVCIVPADQAETVCRDIIKRFDEMIPNLYDEPDRRAGCIEGKTRQGQPLRFPLMGVALVIVSSRDRDFTHPGEISSLASELKTYAKSFGKSIYVMDRRKSRDGRPPLSL
ncbi:MAG: response regulator, partial [Elusimicrobia bacterium]|nr:response regulator [Elusimicrobiota bacterium]